jgi:homoserine kinase
VTSHLARVRVPATSANLGAGYDCLGIALARHVQVSAHERSPGDVRVTTVGHGSGRIGTGDDNLVWTSLVAFCEAHDVAVPDVALHVRNEIPLARGLGSSSAAIVAGLVLGRALCDVSVGTGELVELAIRMEGHPDNVAPALLGGFVAGATTDDGATVIRRAQPASALTVVVAIPGVEQLTRAAREMVPESLPRAAVISQVGRAAHLTGALVGAWPPDVAAAGDLLHEPARLPHMPVTAAVLAAWRDAGIVSWLSGAGPAAAALVDATPAAVDRATAIARDVLAGWPVQDDAEPACHEAVHLPFDTVGATVV